MKRRIATFLLGLAVFIPTLAYVTEAPANAAVVSDLRHIDRHRDGARVDHDFDLWFYHRKYPGTAPRYHWVKFATYAAKINLTGGNYDCSPNWWTPEKFTFSHTRFALSIWNGNTSNPGINKVIYLNCDDDTIDSALKGMSETPRMRWRVDHYGGIPYIKWRVFMTDTYFNWVGDTKHVEHQFSGTIYHYE